MQGTLKEITETYYFPNNPAIRSKKTHRQYAYALIDLAAALGREPTFADLRDDSISAMLAHLTARGLKPKTANERAGRIMALWRWLYARRHIDTQPQDQSLREPRRVPMAWTRAELDSLIKACGLAPGMIEGVPASWWWMSLHYVLWDSGERIGALIQSRWEWLSRDDQGRAWLILPADVRKAQKEDATYQLSPDSIAWLDMIQRPKRNVIWPWPYTESYLWIAYKRLRKRAGLPTDRQSSFHRMRRSVASHFEAAGGNATVLLGHSDRKVTVQSYLDPRVAVPPQAADRLFRLAPLPPAE